MARTSEWNKELLVLSFCLSLGVSMSVMSVMSVIAVMSRVSTIQVLNWLITWIKEGRTQRKKDRIEKTDK